jgi:prophage DNA circulation protein
MAKAKRTIAKSAAVTKSIEAALASLGTACVAGDSAVAKRGKDGKSLAAATKRLSKKRAVLAKRKVLSAKRAKASPSGETRKALRAVIKELATTKSQLLKARTAKGINAVELSALKAAQRRASAYAKAIAQAERSLAKSAKG